MTLEIDERAGVRAGWKIDVGAGLCAGPRYEEHK